MVIQRSVVKPVDNNNKIYAVHTLHQVHFVSASSREEAIDYVKENLVDRFDMYYGCEETVEVYIV